MTGTFTTIELPEDPHVTPLPIALLKRVGGQYREVLEEEAGDPDFNPVAILYGTGQIMFLDDESVWEAHYEDRNHDGTHNWSIRRRIDPPLDAAIRAYIKKSL